MECSPQFFEQLIVNLIVAMGYGGSISDAGKAVGKSGDGGIDGIVKEDVLGLDKIYLQGKCWANPVSRPDIQAFVGSFVGLANKGIFITKPMSMSVLNSFSKLLATNILPATSSAISSSVITLNIGLFFLN